MTRPTYHYGVIATLLIALVLIWATFAIERAQSAEQSECFSLQELQTSFAVVLPKADQVILEGESAHAYLEEFNSIGEQTDYEGEALFLSILPTGVVMMIPIKDGLGCRRRVVHPKLHKHIMSKIGRRQA